MEAADSSKKLLSIYRNAGRHISEYNISVSIKFMHFISR
jgi:hypothetical protein